MSLIHLVKFVVKEEHDAKWLRLLYHNSAGGIFFTPDNVRYNPFSSNLYSILKFLPKIRKYDNSFEFLLEYPGKTGYNRWKQDKNPLVVKEPISNEKLGFQPVNLTWKGYYFSGLALSSFSSHTLLDGLANYSDYWHYAVGAYKEWETFETFPGPLEPGLGTFSPKEVILYIRIKEFHHLFNIACSLVVRKKLGYLPYLFLYIGIK